MNSPLTPPPPPPTPPPLLPLRGRFPNSPCPSKVFQIVTVDRPMTWGSPVPAWSLLRSTNPAAKAMVQANKAMITVAVSCTPEPGDDVVAHYSSIQSALGVTRARAELYCNIGLLCRRMPRLKQHLSAGMLSIDHLRQLARSVDGVRPEDTAAAENALIKVLTPRRTGQSIFSPRTMFNHILKALHTIDALARPVDDTEPPMDPVTLADYCGDAEQSEPAPDLDPERQSEQDAIELAAAEAADAMADETDSATSTTRRVSVDTYDPLSTVITATLPAAEAVEFMTILDAVCANMRCNRAEALMHLAHGTAEVEVTLNLYREINSDIVATDSGHWLDKVATRKFMDRVTHLRIPGHDVTETYTPTGQIRDFVTACYGTCTFPGCEVPATRCDLDHIHRYDHENPENGGPTDTHNLHPVCRRHHQLKTLGWQDVSRAADGAVMWSSVDDGHTYVSEPTGPLAGFARTTFAEQASHRYRATRDHNIRVAGRHLALRRALLDARTTAANDPCEVPF